MNEIRRLIHRKTIIGRVEAGLESQLANVFSFIEKMNPDLIRDGFTFQAGWSDYILRQCGDGEFRLIAPDFSGDPLSQTTEDLTLALWTQQEQTQFLRMLNVDGQTTGFRDKIVLSEGITAQNHIYFERSNDAEKGDSGWYIGPADTSESGALYAVYAYELLKIKPQWIRLLALPTGYLVVIEDEIIQAVLNDQDIDLLSKNGKQ